jgi:hypothetical protein
MKTTLEAEKRPPETEGNQERQTGEAATTQRTGRNTNTVAKQHIREHRNQIVKTELDQLLTSLDPTPRQAMLVCLFAHRLAHELTTGPIRTLEEADDPELGHIAIALFGGDETT